MANGKKKAKKGAKKAAKQRKAEKDEGAKCKLPLVCAYLEKVAPPSGPSIPNAAWFSGVQSCLEDLVLAVTRLERNIHFNDTTETGPAFSVLYNPGGGGKNPPPPPPTYP